MLPARCPRQHPQIGVSMRHVLISCVLVHNQHIHKKPTPTRRRPWTLSHLGPPLGAVASSPCVSQHAAAHPDQRTVAAHTQRQRKEPTHSVLSLHPLTAATALSLHSQTRVSMHMLAVKGALHP
jgi:hypothetical protein